MDIPQKCLCDIEQGKTKKITIVIHMKKMEGGSLTNSNSILSSDTNNNNSNSNNHSVDSNSSPKSENKSNTKNESSTISCGKKAFYKLIFNKSSSNNNNNSNNNITSNSDSNNNSNVNNNSNSNQSSAATPPLNNSYTKVSMERTASGSIESKISQMSNDQSRQSTVSLQPNHNYQNQGNSLIVSPTSMDVNRRYNSSLDEYRLVDTDELARLQRALEIQVGIELDQVSPPDLIESLTSRTSTSTDEDLHCKRCQQQMQYRQMGIVQQTLLHQSIADDEINPNPRYHSQVAYCHYLVPDLEKITACCYYWGKMDRYEAEKLLEGKPEGTFLLRDSAQDDYLFSVSFRKYGRSLHARIEQFNHKFSFDSHDPSVFMASTVTGLVEHYKDPTSVMFFEPMLTSPLHRNHVFSLQQLCRAAIVSHTTYDGINKLCLPLAMKNYLKEYHYKLRVRVKQFPEGVAYQNS